ncbi:hypothetical protein PQO01_05250 [Lentisphaera marina]|uniref:hypothetical protein n=1 Tax=Lentisphaera marina TaxID=1111041 RepID=UPI0023663970|nr:hypothetical protein [Lentisphaera marina]MDD7984352.1 hypothetical protein [Lentisphaera marina]
MLKPSHILLLALTLLVSFSGILPENSLLCLGENGEIELEGSSLSACACEQERKTHLHETDESDHCDELTCAPQDCVDIEITSPISTTIRDIYIIPMVFPILTDSQLFVSRKLTTNIAKPFFRSHKPSLPPPHLKTLAITQVLI